MVPYLFLSLLEAFRKAKEELGGETKGEVETRGGLEPIEDDKALLEVFLDRRRVEALAFEKQYPDQWQEAVKLVQNGTTEHEVVLYLEKEIAAAKKEGWKVDEGKLYSVWNVFVEGAKLVGQAIVEGVSSLGQKIADGAKELWEWATGWW